MPTKTGAPETRRKLTRKEIAKIAANARWSRRSMRTCPKCKGKGEIPNTAKKSDEAAA